MLILNGVLMYLAVSSSHTQGCPFFSSVNPRVAKLTECLYLFVTLSSNLGIIREMKDWEEVEQGHLTSAARDHVYLNCRHAI